MLQIISKFSIKISLESCDGIRRTNELAMNTGYQRRTREIADWARSKRRRYIRREDLLAYLAGKSSPPSGMIHVTRLSPQHLYTNTQQSKPLYSQHIGSGSPVAAHQMQPHAEHHHLHSGTTFSSMDSDMHTFKEALARRSRLVKQSFECFVFAVCVNSLVKNRLEKIHGFKLNKISPKNDNLESV